MSYAQEELVPLATALFLLPETRWSVHCWWKLLQRWKLQSGRLLQRHCNLSPLWGFPSCSRPSVGWLGRAPGRRTTSFNVSTSHVTTTGCNHCGFISRLFRMFYQPSLDRWVVYCPTQLTHSCICCICQCRLADKVSGRCHHGKTSSFLDQVFGCGALLHPFLHCVNMS